MMKNEDRDKCISYCDDILLLIEEYKEDYSRYYFQYLCNSCIVWIGQMIDASRPQEPDAGFTELLSVKESIQAIWDDVVKITPSAAALSEEKLNASIRELQSRIANLKELLAGELSQKQVGDTKENG